MSRSKYDVGIENTIPDNPVTRELDLTNWNVVMGLYQNGFKQASRALRKLGAVERSSYHNISLMSAEDPMALLDAVERVTEESPALYSVSRITPAIETVELHSPKEFRDKVKDCLLRWTSQLGGRSFHVRFHRRGLKTDLRTPDVEQFLDDALLDRLKQDASR
jgi:hypothetical protein